MFDDAFASIAAGFSDRMSGPFIDAVAWWPGEPVKDLAGSITSPGTPVTLPCKAQFDAPTQAMRQAEGFMEQDARVLVLAGSLSAELDEEAQVRVADGVNAGKWSLLTVTRDPAGVGYECRARRIG